MNASKFLSIVPPEKILYFCTSEGDTIKVTANSLEDFASKLDGVDANSLEFHYPRGDFQAWIKDVLGDSVLAERLCFIEKNTSGEALRKEILKVVQKRIAELKNSVKAPKAQK
jgi:hypothetical protein